MIDVIIPAYNAHKTIETTLCSIAFQDIVDKLHVYIVDDCSDKGYKKYVKFFSNFMDITELKLEKNSGPGVARQFGVDNSSSEYIVFIDSDDVFLNCLSLKRLLNAIEKGHDVVISTFLEELNTNYYERKNDRVWLHGKIYRRSYLEEKNIKFNNTRQNEDNGFNQLIFLSGADTDYINEQTYIWRNNTESITRKNEHEYRYTGIEGYIYNITWAIKEAIKRNSDSKAISEMAYITLIAVYYYYLEFEATYNVNKFIKMSKDIIKYYNADDLDEKEKNNLMKDQFEDLVHNGNLAKIMDPSISFSQFLKKIEGEK